jgi:UDP-2-acetamido-2-deoxy-ribo-hexuluronate aminotransferase
MSNLPKKIRIIKNHGQSKRHHHSIVGVNSCLDNLQAAILNVKLKYYEKEIRRRQEIAELYTSLLTDKVQTPKVLSDRSSVWAQYTIRVKNRDTLQARLKEAGIPTTAHYSKPLHLQEAFAFTRSLFGFWWGCRYGF